MARRSTSRLLVQYLLGELSPLDREWIERQYFMNPEVWQLLLETEINLIDAYIYGQLSEHERERFEDYFMDSPKIRKRVALAVLLKNCCARA
jgi:anti-sigma factor RsiW